MRESSPAQPLVEIRGLRKDFELRRSLAGRVQKRPADVLRAVDGVDLNVARGEVLGLVGESGSGKSTLGRCVVGLYRPTAGELRFDGQPLGVRRSRADRRRIQMVFQDPYTSLNPRRTVRETLVELLRVHELVPTRAIETRCRELLALVNLRPDALDAYPHQFSGGQRQRVSLARALALEPELLIADEPVSALDVSVQVTVLKLLLELRERLGLTIVLIAHNMAVVRHVSDRVAVMYLGRIVEVADADAVLSKPRHPYTQALLAAVPRLVRADRARFAIAGDPPSAIHLPSGCRFHPRCPRAEGICSELDPPLAPGPAGTAHLAACHFAWTDAAG